jgi:hypothetical protein
MNSRLSLCACVLVHLVTTGCDSRTTGRAEVPAGAVDSVAVTAALPAEKTVPDASADTPLPRTAGGLEVQPQMALLQQRTRGQSDLGYTPATTAWRAVKAAPGDSVQRATPGALLAALSASRGWSDMVGNSVWEQTTRIYSDDDERAVGVVLQWGFEDDSVAGHDYKVHMTLRDGKWRVERIEERDHCSRRVSTDGICA